MPRMAKKTLVRKVVLGRKTTPVQKPARKAVKQAAKKPPIKALPAASDAAPAAVEKKQTKTSFVLSFPADVPAKEVVAKAKEAGIAITEKAVYKTRYLSRNKASKTAKKPPVKAAPKAVKKAVTPAKKPGKRGPGDGSASAFIRQQALSLKASEVVAAGAKQGIKITPGLVYAVRGQMKKAGAKAPKAPSAATGKRRGRPPSAAKATPKAAPKAVVMAGGGDRERQLVQLAVDIGLGRAIELIEGIRAKIGSLI